jgi:hypothetical protein
MAPADRRIVPDPAVLAGKPVVRGTRLSVEFIIGLMRLETRLAGMIASRSTGHFAVIEPGRVRLRPLSIAAE